jgi:hypothetical protein
MGTLMTLDLSPALQGLLRTGYGLLLLGTLVMTAPHARRFFASERWLGYAQSSPMRDRIHHPVTIGVLYAVWLAAAALITVGRWTIGAALMNLLLCRHFFINERWKGLLRGMGAPGFVSYWLAACVFFLELSLRDATGGLRGAVLTVFRADFACIILAAAIYKVTAGYPQNHGMELGLANPEWGYWWRLYHRLPPGHFLFRTFNHLAWATEMAAAALMLAPGVRWMGAALLMVSFAFVLTQIRLGWLCEMVILCGVLYLTPGGWVDRWAQGWLPPSLWSVGPSAPLPAPIVRPLTWGLWAYLALLPFAYAGLYYNFYGRKALPGRWQRTLERYTNAFGMILWRVFTVDVINFFVRIHRETAAGARRLVSRYGALDRASWFRYDHVGESICVTSIFTALKYFPSRPEIFRERLLRYARTVPCPADAVLVFEYVSILRQGERFALHPVREYRVDPRLGTIGEQVLDPAVSVTAAHSPSSAHEGAAPGSYAPPAGAATRVPGAAVS